jgi:hypothetical protein
MLVGVASMVWHTTRYRLYERIGSEEWGCYEKTSWK